MGPTQSRMGLVTFQTWPTTRFNLGKALWKVVTDMKFRSNSQVHKIVVVFTDGQSFDHVNSPVKKLKKQGVDMIAFGVGDVKEETLLQLAAGVQDNVYSVANYGELKNFMGSLVTKICAFVNSLNNK